MAVTPLQERIRAFGRGDLPMHQATRTGKVVGIQEHYDDKDKARVDLEDEAPPTKKAKNGKVVDTFGRRFEAVVPKAHTAGIKLGDRVHVHTKIEKAAGRAPRAKPRSAPSTLPTPASVMDHALPSITVMPHISDGEGGWYVVIGGEGVAGPFSEDEASRQLARILAQ